MSLPTEFPGPDGTESYTGQDRPRRGDSEWGRTVNAVDRVRYEGFFFEEPDLDSPNGYFAGRPIIGSGTRINGGVYLGGGEREAIVVDDQKEPRTLAAYRDLLEHITIDGEVRKETAMQAVYETVQSLLPYDEEGVEELGAQFSPDQKVGLGNYLKARAGVCRHQALLAGYLLEKLKDDGILRGQVAVRRNSVGGIGAHAWAEYTTFDGETYVIDPAQQYFGLKKDAEVRGARWRY